MLFGDTMVSIIEQDSILPLGYSSYMRNIILLGSTTKKTLLAWVWGSLRDQVRIGAWDLFRSLGLKI